MIYVILLIMFFLHITSDYYLPNNLTKIEQIWWWIENSPNSKYRNDYIVALIEHGFIWTFIIHTPFFIIYFLRIYTIQPWIPIITFLFNWVIYTITTDLRVNKLELNLVENQVINLFQIIITWGALFIN